mmetsp:Transcript_41445/g.100138  ORF Transcript_41445/g.100138 Transcript_41445/m.100138 type:complete len:484 (+) Transcript_41445:155-1606(+)
MIADKVPPEVVGKLQAVVTRMSDKDAAGSESGKSKEDDDDDDDKEKRIRLSQQQAIEIFMLRPQPSEDGVMRRGSMLHCKSIAPRFNVTPKTIRDIWNGRTWSHATRHLWTRWEKQRRSFFLQDECGDGRVGIAGQDEGVAASNMSMMVDSSGMGGAAHFQGDGAGASAARSGMGAGVGSGGQAAAAGVGEVSMGGLAQQTLGGPQGFWPFVSGHMGAPGMGGVPLAAGGAMSSQDSHMQAMTHFLQMQQHAQSMSAHGGYGMPGGGYPGAFPGGGLNRPDISGMPGLAGMGGAGAPGGDGGSAGSGGQYGLTPQQQQQQQVWMVGSTATMRQQPRWRGWRCTKGSLVTVVVSRPSWAPGGSAAPARTLTFARYATSATSPQASLCTRPDTPLRRCPPARGGGGGRGAASIPFPSTGRCPRAPHRLPARCRRSDGWRGKWPQRCGRPQTLSSSTGRHSSASRRWLGLRGGQQWTRGASKWALS